MTDQAGPVRRAKATQGGRVGKAKAIRPGQAQASSTAAPAGGEMPPVLEDAATRSAGLIDVGTDVDIAAKEAAIYALAAARRRHNEVLHTDFAISLLEHAGASEAQLFQDIFALFFASFKRNGFFVEVGTGDGKLISNTYLLEKGFGWSGVVAEPNPVFWPALKEHRTCAISPDCVFDVTGRRVNFSLTANPEFSGIIDGLTDLHTDKRGDKDRLSEVETISLNDLLLKYGCPADIDYISLDVEGAEFEILQTFDFNNHRVRCISVEHNWTANREKIYDLLSDNGFLRVFEHLSQWDDWYIHRDVAHEFPAAHYLILAAEPAEDVEQPHRFLDWALEAMKQEDWQVAESLCLRAVEIDPTFSAGYRTLAEIAVRRGRRAVALGRWRQATAANPDDYWARIGLAGMLAAGGAIAEAAALLENVRDPEGDPPRARALFEELSSKLHRPLPQRGPG